MAARRYKAGTIFLDVAPSFDKVQDKIKEYVEKGGLNKVFEDQGRESGEAFADAEAKGYAKKAKQSSKARVTETKAVNKIVVSDARDSARQMIRASEDAQLAETAALKKGMKARAKIRQSEVDEAKTLRQQINHAHGQAIQEQTRREREAAQERKRLADDERKAGEKALRESLRLADDERKAEAKAQRERAALHADALREDARRDADALKAREKAMEASGGRIGRLIRKSVGGALEDLPEVELDANSTKVDRALADVRTRLLAMRDVKIGVDISTKQATTQLKKIKADVDVLSRTHNGSISINAMAALASLQAVDSKIDKIQRDAKRPIILRLITRATGGGGASGGGGGLLSGASGGGENGANAFRIFNVMVLAVVASLSLMTPLLAVAAAGLVTIGGAAMAGAAGLGVLALSFQGIVSAVQAQIKAEDDLGKKAATTAKKRSTGDTQVRDAKERLADAETNAARATEDAARRVSDAERGVADARKRAASDIADAIESEKDARRSLVDAQQQVTADVERAVEQQAQAERRLEDAQRSAAQVQRDLTESRREARREIEDLSMSYRQSQLAETEAAIAVTQSQERLNEVRRRASKGDASGADVRQAQVDVQQARLRAEEAKTRRRRAGQDSSIASKKGVEGSDRVMSAKERVRSAEQGVVDAQKGLADSSKAIADARAEGAERVADAERGVAKASQETAEVRASSARSILDAERNVTDALRAQSRVAQDNARSIRDAKQGIVKAQAAVAESAEAMSTAAYDAQKSMSDLTPEGQRFAKFILGLRGGYKELRNLAQAGVLPGLQAGLSELSVYGDGFKKFVTDMSKMWGDSFRMMGKELTGPTWSSFFATMGKDGPKQAGLLNRALFNVLTTIAALADAFSPMTTEMLTWLSEATKGWADWAANLKGSPGFEKFMAYVREAAPVVRDLFVSLGAALINIGVALAPFSEGVAKVFTAFFEWIAGMDPKILGQIAVAIIAVVVGIQVMAGVMSLLSGATLALSSPLAALILIVVALAVWMIHLYRTNETARGYIDKMIATLKQMAHWVWDNKVKIGILVGVIAGLFVIAKVALVIAGFVLTATKMAKAIRLVGLAVRFVSLLFNPWVIAIALVAAAVIYLWKTNDSFRTAVIAGWTRIKAVLSAVADWWTQTAAPAFGRAFAWIADNVVPALTTALEWLGKAVTWLWENVIHPYVGLMYRYWAFVFRAIAAVAKWLWNDILKPVFTELSAWVKEIIAPTILWLWNNVFKPAFNAIGKAAMALWNDFIKPAFKVIVYFIQEILAPAMSWLWKNIVSPIFGWIGSKISGTFNKRILPIFKLLRYWLKNVVGPAFKWLWEKGVAPSMRGISSLISWLWKRARPNFDKLKAGVDAVKKAFGTAKDGIAKIWGKLESIVSKPIRAVLKFIQTNFIDKLNSMLKAAGLDLRIGRIWNGDAAAKKPATSRGANSGSWKAAYGAARGGILPGYTPMSAGDDHLRPMRSGEGVLVSEGLRDPRSKSMFLAANEAAKSGTSFADFLGGGYAKGGIVDLGKRLQKLGYHVSEHPSFGGVAPGAHSAGGYHYKGGALDINADPFNSNFGKPEPQMLDKLNAMLRSEGWNTIWRAANHYDHLHVDIAKGQKGGISGALSGIADKALSFLTKGAKGVIKRIPGDNMFAEMSKGLLTKMLSGFEGKVNDEAGMLDMGEAGGMSGKGVERWRPMVLKALGILGLDKKYANATLRQIGTESGGNPRAINLWDSNAKKGTPSKGLLQTIDSTYRAYAHPKYNKGVYDPLSNILASMRYATATYGDLFKAYRGVGYATGVDSATPGWHMVGENGPELMHFTGGEQVYNRQQTLRLAELSSKAGQQGNVTVMVQNPFTGEYLLAKVDQRIDSADSFKTSIEGWRNG